MSAAGGTPSAPSGTDSGGAASVVAAGSATTSEAEAAASSADPVVDGQRAVLQPRQNKETTISSNSKRFEVTLEPPILGRRKLTAWCWRYVSRFTPTIDNKSVVCLW